MIDWFQGRGDADVSDLREALGWEKDEWKEEFSAPDDLGVLRTFRKHRERRSPDGTKIWSVYYINGDGAVIEVFG